MMPFRRFGMLGMIGAMTIGACQSTPPTIYGALEVADAQTMAVVESVLARAMNRASIEIGPGDLTKTSVVSVLPPRLSPNETRSTAQPTQFDIIIKGAKCFVVRRDTAKEYELSGVACRPLDA